ncbi:DMT family transporter [Fusobacterium sp.]|uniref:DMT family transporter n=1 Tax=Fusobacterium sp. TaxID=68766 RepID=UPI0028FF5F43|nr:DMT family transporter [Fusobacterium sp.]MDU1910401.1 DMT family transporter [Fusobacterium sp.]
MSNKTKAVFSMLISALGFTLMSVAVKYLKDIPLFEKVFFRNLVSLVVAFYLIKKSSSPVFGQKKNQLALLARSVFGLAGVILNFYAITHLTLADSTMLGKLSPIFVTIMACLFLKEKIDKEQIIGIFITFVGALLVIKPQFSLSIIPSISGLLSAAFSGTAYTLLRYLKDKENPDTIVFYFSIISVIGTLPFVLADYIMPTSTQFLLLLATGLFASIGQFGVTYAYKYSKATEVSIYTYSAIVFGILLGFIFFHEIPDILSLLGGGLIIAMAYYTFRHNQKKD